MKAAGRKPVSLPSYRARRWSLVGILAIAALVLVWRAVDQQIFETDFLQEEGERRHLRVVEMPAHRGMITDREGEPLAISTPVDSVWANPRVLSPDRRGLEPLAKALQMKPDDLRQILARRSDRSFVYLKRRITPDTAAAINKLVKERKIKGVGLERGYRRYYPGGEVFAHVVGFTDMDDVGQEGAELAYEDWLRSTPGKKLVLRDGHSTVVRDVESIQAPEEGKDLVLSLDRRLQYLAYRELKIAVKQHKAESGSVVILDVRSGEVLAMVNQPAYNPNGSKAGRPGRFRNRAVTDVFEPGSTMKPFTAAAALETGRYHPSSMIDTTPGYLQVGKNRVRDHHNLGVIDISTIIRKSSNVGISRIALDLTGKQLWGLYSGMGFGESTGVGYPGEAGGQLTPYTSWARIDQATLAFGYGISVTSLQLARAYAILASGGVKRPVSLLRVERPVKGRRVISKETAHAVLEMMESVVSRDGTAQQAAVAGYRMAGKTGTGKKSVSGGYSEDHYLSLFAGVAPVSDPRLVMVVMIDDPRGENYYGGLVAAPVFAKVMSGALRLLNIAPDDMKGDGVRLAAARNQG
ncbi:MAG: penicillin-binding protein 2 [Chromatiaceae bacterium]|nr:penicillin-binding protein 2 [Chromatiaceae bacterium]MCP5408139.1 penicillin-binding protein 2 [Chromatiaceae bacterium]MCP5443038.1 penicillin-binding protein 2 [Chromatiaceae bacterium]